MQTVKKKLELATYKAQKVLQAESMHFENTKQKHTVNQLTHVHPVFPTKKPEYLTCRNSPIMQFDKKTIDADSSQPFLESLPTSVVNKQNLFKTLTKQEILASKDQSNALLRRRIESNRFDNVPGSTIHLIEDKSTPVKQPKKLR